MRRRGMGRSGRPGLLGTAARTAVVVKTANAVSASSAQKRGAAAGPPAAAAPPPPAPSAPEPAGGVTDELVGQLQKLGELRDAGILTEDEFTAKKAKLLGL